MGFTKSAGDVSMKIAASDRARPPCFFAARNLFHRSHNVRITVIADPLIPVPPLRYGGSERIVGALCRGLSAAGHSVRLLAGPGSRIDGEVVVYEAPGPSVASASYHKVLFQTLSLWVSRDADVVHCYSRADYLVGLLALKMPLVYSFMNPITPWDQAFFFRSDRGKLMLVSASDNHRRDQPVSSRWHTVYPAIDIDRIPFQPARRGDYLAFLGRLTENKGAREAIAVAQRAGLPLKIAGNVSNEPGGVQYFEEEILPHLGGDIEWVGEITDDQKGDFLGNARALLFPIQWEEPFGIAVAESFAAGTPVIATRRGATSEQIVDGVTGFICDSVEEMVQATARIDALDRRACRETCQRRFSAPVMAQRYLDLYGRLLEQR